MTGEKQPPLSLEEEQRERMIEFCNKSEIFYHDNGRPHEADKYRRYATVLRDGAHDPS